jgi:4-diphosphocytidyl-2-C-methyl-D-erythritol kinase
MSDEIEIISPAKINLFLRVVGKQPDGYHQLVSLMCPISLHDRIRIQFFTKQMQITCNDPQVPNNKNNLAFKAAEQFFQATSYEDCVNITLEKKIPIGAGLGGGSSNAAAVLLALNKWYQKPLNSKQLKIIALSLGADVPFFLENKIALVRGIGEHLYHVKMDIRNPLIIVYPNFSVSTAWVFKNFKFDLTKEKLKDIKSNLISRYKNFHDVNWMSDIYNDLEKITFQRYPILSDIKIKLKQLGAVQTVMSGSGSSVVGIFSEETIRQRVLRQLEQQKTWQIFACQVEDYSSFTQINNKNVD